MTKKLWFQVGVGILLAILIIRYFLEIKGIFSPIFIIGKTIFLPLLLGGVLYYITEPIQRFLEKRKFLGGQVFSLYLQFLLPSFGFLHCNYWSTSYGQMNNLVENSPVITQEIK